MAVFWVVAPMMEAARTSETLVNFHQITKRNNPEDSHLHTRRRENLKSHRNDKHCTQTFDTEFGARREEFKFYYLRVISPHLLVLDM
jgi:hypothetical protein